MTLGCSNYLRSKKTLFYDENLQHESVIKNTSGCNTTKL